MPVRLVSGISSDFPGLSQSQGQVAHVLLTRSPLIPGASTASPFDLHVLSTPPAFVLSQNQTLRQCLAPPDPKTRQQTLRTVQTDQDSASIKDPPPTGWTADPHLNHQPTRQHQAGHMASTTWHTVEFSRNRRASVRDLSIRPGGNLSNLADPVPLVKPLVSGSLIGRARSRRASQCRRHGRRLEELRGASPAGPAIAVRSAVSVPPCRATSRTLRSGWRGDQIRGCVTPVTARGCP